MRKIMLIATLVALGVAGAASAAVIVTQTYVVTAKATKKSGTKAHPKPIGITISYKVNPHPSADRPKVVKTQVVTINGVQGHGNAFPTCSTSTLNSKTGGPTKCAKGSQVGTGFFLVVLGAANKPSSKSTPCRADLKIYNGGGNSQSFYAYANPVHANECKGVAPLAFAVRVKQAGQNLVQTINVPLSLRHPGNNTAVDAAAIQASVTIPIRTRKVKGKTVGYGESIACPANHRRHIAIKYTTEDGKSQTATANVACS